MKKKYFHILILIIFLTIAAASSLYTVDVEDVAIITQFGEVVGSPREPGLHSKIPFIQEAYYYPVRRVFRWKEKTFTLKTLDKKDIQVSLSVEWRISDAAKFYREIKHIESAAYRLKDLLNSSLLNYLGSNKYSDIENNYLTKTEENEVFLNQKIIDQIMDKCNPLLDKLGMKIYGLEIQMI